VFSSNPTDDTSSPVKLFRQVDHVEREVIEPREAPDGEGEQEADLERRVLQHQQERCEQAGEEEEEAFEEEQPGVGNVAHGLCASYHRPPCRRPQCWTIRVSVRGRQRR
jgi:hypothetical protein